MTHIRSRTDSAANWAAENPVLQDGERGHERNTRKSKTGDGVTAWNDLAYEVSAVVATKADVGLDQVDNTADMDKPITSAQDAINDALAADLAGKASLASPVFTGNPQAPTPAVADADTSIATTAFVAAAVAASSLPQALSSARPTHREGLLIYEIDTDQIMVSDGTNWLPVWYKTPPVDGVGSVQWRRKSATQNLTNSSVLVNDLHLTFPGLANAVYELNLTLFLTVTGSSSAADFKCTLNGPAGGTWGGFGLVPDLALTGTSGSIDVAPWPPGSAFGGVKGVGVSPSATTEVHLRASVTIGATPGDVTFQWAQNTATAVQTSVLLGSRMRIERII
jgi:hypothetical protein